MKKFGIVVNEEKDKKLKYAKVVANAIINNGGEVFIDIDVVKKCAFNFEGYNECDIFDKCEIIVCLGGDGTFLQTARKIYKKNIPMIGINLGTLGFLTEIEKCDIEEAIKRIIQDDFYIEERMMLEITIKNNNNIKARDTALNDIVISRAAFSRILYLDTYINNAFVETIPGDGIILATPTGSTAYSLSAGGPVLEPDVNMIVITPICPHNTYTKSFVTSGEREVKVQLNKENSTSALVSVDGQNGYEIYVNDVIETKKSDTTVKIIKLHPTNFFNVLRNKFCSRRGM